MHVETSIDISDTINEIIDLLGPLYEKRLENGEDGLLEFIAAMFGAITKLCHELHISEEESDLLFKHMWQVVRRSENEELN